MLLFPVLLLGLSGVVFLAGGALNGYVLFVVGCRVERTVSAVWFWNRGMTDLIFIVFLPLRFTSIFIPDLNWAKILGGTITSFHMFSSAFLLTALSVDRCLLVARPEWKHRTPASAFVMVLYIWALSLGFSLRYGDLQESLLSIARTNRNVQLDEGRLKAAVAIQFLVGFLIPLALILIPTFYIVLAAKLRGNRPTQSTKPLRILLGLILTFFLCWLPYHVFSFMWISATYPPPVLEVGSAIACVPIYFSSCLNPIFYLTMEEEFRRDRQRARNPQITDNSGPEPDEYENDGIVEIHTQKEFNSLDM